jgi:hypothetical protein
LQGDGAADGDHKIEENPLRHGRSFLQMQNGSGSPRAGCTPAPMLLSRK